MSMSSTITSNTFSLSARARLARFLHLDPDRDAGKIIALTPDASTREYFRIPWKGEQPAAAAIAAVYPESFDPETQPFLDVTRLFAEANLPVPNILAVDGTTGIIVQEDFGDRQLGHLVDAASEPEREEYIKQAISLIAQIQRATDLAYKRDSVSSRIAFDEAKLMWELNFFLEHYFGSLRGEPVGEANGAELKAEMGAIARELAARPRVLCHRDFHVANLMVDAHGRLRVMDYQDARMGPVTYDLVSLILDRRTAPPEESEVRARALFFLEERARLGLEQLEVGDFTREFTLMTVQRCLKAVGTFSFQTAKRGRGSFYGRFINPMLLIVLEAAERLERFPALRSAISTRLEAK